MNKIKNFLTIILFSIVIFGICISSLILPDSQVSYAERRKLAQASSIKEESVFSSEFSGKIENYLLDQFPLREKFRSVNAITRYWVFNQQDVNGLWLSEGSIFKASEDFDEKQILYGTGLINRIISSNLKGANVYYSVLPDKNYFLKDNRGDRFEYEKLLGMLDENISGAKYIDIFDTLSLDDYYKTDTHWSQEKIFPTVEKLTEAMGTKEYLSPKDSYKTNELKPFYGVYWGQAALSANPDSLYYLTNDYTENAKVYGIDPKVLKEDFGVEDTLEKKVYSINRFNGMDGYDVYLSGAQPIVVIESENAKTDRELVIFRDSYGSSIAPLFTGAYSKITLVDLRYIPSFLVPQFVEFKEGQDVLFLYSAMMLNGAMVMK